MKSANGSAPASYPTASRLRLCASRRRPIPTLRLPPVVAQSHESPPVRGRIPPTAPPLVAQVQREQARRADRQERQHRHDHLRVLEVQVHGKSSHPTPNPRRIPPGTALRQSSKSASPVVDN